jgi:hypothetical protein
MPSNKTQGHITFVIFENEESSKCFKISKKAISQLFIVVPIFFLFLVLIILGLINLVFLKSPSNGPGYNNLIQTLNPISNSKTLNQSTLNKAILPQTETTIANVNEGTPKLPIETKTHQLPLIQLNLFERVENQEDLTNMSSLVIKNVKTIKHPNLVEFSFDIIQMNPELGKINGHIVVIMKDDHGLHFYPPATHNLNHKFLISYKDGESFTVSRLRPTSMKFPSLQKDLSNISFKIYLFSKSGDLLFQKTL